ncbi:MAG: DNA translocase FtsK [Patescibacteria group bacterium]
MAKKSRGRRKKPFKVKFKKETVYTFSSVALFVIAAIIMFSFSQQGTLLKRLFLILSHYFGWGIILLPFLFVSSGLMLARLRWSVTQPNVFAGFLIFSGALVSITKAGLLGQEIWRSLVFLISGPGAFFVLAGFCFIGFVIAFNTSLEEIILFFIKFFKVFSGVFAKLKGSPKQRFSTAGAGDQEKPMINAKKPIMPDTSKEKGEKTEGLELRPSISANVPVQGKVWEYPPISLLNASAGGKADRGDVNKNADIIEKTLESFGIVAKVVEVNYGPAVTQYALEIALGTKLSKITTLANDLALALAAPTGQIRIEAPIPGRNLVGIEVPNRSAEFVSLRQMLVSSEMKKSKSKLSFGLGLNVSGEEIVDDIARMPHVLIAGATGSGKSICINSLIANILFRASPDEVKFILIDPKRVELTGFNGIPHLLTPVIVDPESVLSALGWAVSQMEGRYKIFAEVGVRNIQAYNELSGLSALHYIVIVIDELSDIMLFAPAKVEDTICRLAQMARATGIHLVLSTQRPSVDVITGLIKANISCRISFSVNSQVDSRVIIDTPGAEKLLGRGDMLYVPPDQAKPTRIQGTFVSDEEVKKLISFLKNTGVSPQYTKEVTDVKASGVGSVGGGEEKDEFFNESVRIVCQYDRASASLLQRRLKVGYSRAARIIDQLERAGVVSPAQGSKAREILIENPDEFLAGSAK